MKIIFKDSLTKEEGFSFYESFLKSEENNLIIAKCPPLSEEESLKDSFWKEFVCGDSKESPSYLVCLKVPSTFKDTYPLTGGCTFEFQVVLDILRGALNLSDKEGLDILEDSVPIGNVQYGKIYINSPEKEIVSAISISATSKSIYNFIVALPRNITRGSDWGTLPSVLKDAYIKRRIEKVFDKYNA